MSDFNSLVQYTVENISRPVKYIIYKLTEFIRVVDKFVFRQVPSGAASGYATIEQIEGNTVAWNQLVDTGDTSCTVPNGHVYYANISGTSSIATSDGNAFAVTGGTDNVCDLTAIFGAGNEPTTVAYVEAWMAQNIGTLPYYDYNAGELISCKMESLKSIGFNQWDEEWELGSFDNNGQPTTTPEYQNRIRSKNFIPCFPNTIYYAKNGGSGSLSFYFYDADKNFISVTLANNTTFTTPTGCYYMKFRSTAGYGTTYNNDICINLSDPAKNGTYQPYMTDSADIDVTTITGINTATNVREVIFPNGMKWSNNVNDILDILNDTATVNIGTRVFDGTENWVRLSGSAHYSLAKTTFTNLGTTVGSGTYPCSHFIKGNRSGANPELGASGFGNSYFNVNYDNTTTTPISTFTNYLATQYSNGTPVTLVYPLATPITYTDLQDTNGNPLNPRYKVEQGGTEQVLPVNTSTPTTVAPTLTTTYTKDNN